VPQYLLERDRAAGTRRNAPAAAHASLRVDRRNPVDRDRKGRTDLLTEPASGTFVRIYKCNHSRMSPALQVPDAGTNAPELVLDGLCLSLERSEFLVATHSDAPRLLASRVE